MPATIIKENAGQRSTGREVNEALSAASLQEVSSRPSKQHYSGIPHMGYHLASSFSMGSSFSIKDFSRNSWDVSRFWPLCGTNG